MRSKVERIVVEQGRAYGIAATPDQFLQNRPGTRGPIDGLRAQPPSI